MTWVDWLQQTAYATQIRESQYIYPLMQCVHIVGLGLFAGGVLMTDLRIAGMGRSVPLVAFGRHAMSAAWVGLVLVLLTGIHMAGAFIQVFAVSTVMQLKLTAVCLVIVNAVLV